MAKNKSILLWLAVIAAVFSLAACGGEADEGKESAESNGMQVYFLDVGKGDAALIGIPGGDWVMVDTGPEKGFKEIGRILMTRGIKQLSAVFVTHGHKDHIGGLESVLDMASCGTIYTIPECADEKVIVNAHKEKNIAVRMLTAGDSVDIGGAVFTVVGPVADYENENDQSMVLLFEYGGKRVLFAADQLFEAEKGLLESGKDISADVLKTAHHGQDDSTSTAFLKAVGARYSIIPTDSENPPAGTVMSSISKAGAQGFVLGDTGTLLYDGNSIYPVDKPANEAPDIEISEKDAKAEYVTLTNETEQDADLTGWCLYSDSGNEIFFFPAGTMIKAKESLTVYSGKAAENHTDGLIWSAEAIWKDKKEDACYLFDLYGRQVGKN